MLTCSCATQTRQTLCVALLKPLGMWQTLQGPARNCGAAHSRTSAPQLRVLHTPDSFGCACRHVAQQGLQMLNSAVLAEPAYRAAPLMQPFQDLARAPQSMTLTQLKAAGRAADVVLKGARADQVLVADLSFMHKCMS